jgi:hypothetical protein
MSPLSAYSKYNFNYDYNDKPDKDFETKRNRDTILSYTKNILEKSSSNPDLRKENEGISFRGEVVDNYLDKKYTFDNTINTLHALSLNSNLVSSLPIPEDDRKYESLTKEIKILQIQKEEQDRELQQLKLEVNDFMYENTQLKENLKSRTDYKVKYLQLASDYDNLCGQFEKSEKIREEQNRLIKSLQREIDTLRDIKSENLSNDVSKIYSNAKQTEKSVDKKKKRSVSKASSSAEADESKKKNGVIKKQLPKKVNPKQSKEKKEKSTIPTAKKTKTK